MLRNARFRDASGRDPMHPNAIARLFRPRLRLRRTDQRGASLVEYALLVALIAVVCIVAVSFFGGETGDSLSRTASEIGNV